jgi:four helix bundle protein
MQPHERFIAWQRAHTFVLEIHRETSKWPKEERYGLTSQIRRASFSVAVNIVEGCARRGRREFRRFLDISYASLAETGYILLLARDLGYLAAQERERLESLRAGVAAPLYKLMRAMDQDP